MKKIISLICLALALSTLLCACKGDEPVETQPVTESITTSKSETTSKPAPEKKPTFVDVDGTLSATYKELKKMKLIQFQQGEYLHTYAQGGVIVGNYAYTCMVSPWNRKPYEGVYKTCIVKTDLTTGEVVQKSEALDLGVANDATYNSKDNTIVVCNGLIEDKKIIHIIDADTLELKESKTLPNGAQGIAYIADKDRYVCYKYGTGASSIYIYTYNKDFELITQRVSRGRENSKYDGVKFNCQGIHTDGTYIYMLEWHGGSGYTDGKSGFTESETETKLRIIEISTGTVIDRVDLGIKREPEYVGFRDGKFYIVCNDTTWVGAEFYEVEITTTKN